MDNSPAVCYIRQVARNPKARGTTFGADGLAKRVIVSATTRESSNYLSSPDDPDNGRHSRRSPHSLSPQGSGPGFCDGEVDCCRWRPAPRGLWKLPTL